jgi:hypothetical protein
MPSRVICIASKRIKEYARIQHNCKKWVENTPDNADKVLKQMEGVRNESFICIQEEGGLTMPQKNSDQFEQCCGSCCYMVGEDCYGYGMCAYIFGEHVRCFDKCHNDHFVNKDDAERYIKVLEAHNKWRRDEHVPNSMPMQDPKEIGLAIDFAVDYIKTFMEL